MADVDRVVVYVQRRRRLTNRYILSLVCHALRDRGIEVVVLDDPARAVAADLAILHVNLTRRPASFEAVLSRYPVVVNACVRDISKRVVSRELLTRGSSCDGPVIVKTDANFFGLSEDHLARRSRNPLRSLGVRLARKLPISGNRIRRSGRYLVLERPSQVPADVWRDRSLVVERFLPELRDGYYLLRSWVFLGDREITYVSYSRDPIVKSHNTEHHERVQEVPQAIRAARRRFGFNYGKFDFVLHEGRPVLLDVNPTPTIRGTWNEGHLELGRSLAEGIRGLREGRAQVAGPTPGSQSPAAADSEAGRRADA